jgi:predicted Zn-dependent protease
LSFVILSISGCSSVYNPATGKQEPIFTPSEDNEGKSGQKISKKVEEKFKSVNNWTLQTRIQTIGQKLAAVSDRKDITYHFEVLDEKEVNAFAIPGGYIYVFKGLIDKTSSDDEIAGVLAHEIGHITARHTAKRVNGSLGVNALAILLMNMESDAASKQKAYQGLVELMLEYSMEDEIEADKLAVKYMQQAGYNPEGVVSFLKKLRKIEYEKPIRRAHVFKTHPYIADRIKAAKEEISGKIDFEDYINASDESGF